MFLYICFSHDFRNIEPTKLDPISNQLGQHKGRDSTKCLSTKNEVFTNVQKNIGSDHVLFLGKV